MNRRVRAVWLVDSNEPFGAVAVALRRVRVLRRHVAGSVVALRYARAVPPPGSPYRALLRAGHTSARLSLAEADVLVTTSAETLAFAAEHNGRATPVVHFVHAPLPALLDDADFMSHVPDASRVVVPVDIEPSAFARAVGLDRGRVVAQDDFVLASERLLSGATAKVVLAAGRLGVDSGAAELVAGFALARDGLDGWALRLCGWGEGRGSITELIEANGLQDCVAVVGPSHDIAAEYLAAGVVARVAAADACGLPVLEALAAGVPVLGASAVPAVRALVRHDVNGLVLERTDPGTVADALLTITDPAVHERLIGGARATPPAVLSQKGLQELTELFPRPRRIRRPRAGSARRVPVTGTAGGTDPGVVVGRHTHLLMHDLRPAAARAQLLDEVLAALTEAGVTAFVIKSAVFPDNAVGVLAADRAVALTALADALAQPGVHVQEVYPDVPSQPVSALTGARLAAVPAHCHAVRIARLWTTSGQDLRYGMEYGTVVEFWTPSAGDPDTVVAPRANRAATLVHRDYLAPATIELEGRPWPSIELFRSPFPTDVEFPVDAVYTWVDGTEPAWRERFDRARADADGVEYHAESLAENRYVSRDELRYSLRSLDMYAPWIRHVYLVTDRQVPTWLRPDPGRLTVVDHRDIFSDPSVLPVFNSSAIISQLHHIDGLSEHYLYLNDDVFFGRDVTPETFWFGGGVAKVFPSKQARPFGPAHPGDEPHVNISRNIRAALQESTGRSVSLAIRHTPYPQIRSVNAEIEHRYSEMVRATAAQRFRHHTDIALDQLFHYYAQVTGRAVPASISYEYVNVADGRHLWRLRRLLALRGRAVFCLNDAPEPGVEPIGADEIARFLQAYFPFRSTFER